jgi:hypothetical protein
MQVRNGTFGGTIPAYAVMRVTGVVEVKKETLLTIDQQDASDGPVVFNGPEPIPGGGYGIAQSGPVVVAYFDSAPGPAVGDELGPVDGEWRLTADGVGWTFLGSLGDENIGIFQMRGASSIEVKIGKPDADIAKGASGTVSIWEGEPGSEVDTGDNETATAKARGVTSGKFVTLTRLPGNDNWYVDCWES